MHRGSEAPHDNTRAELAQHVANTLGISSRRFLGESGQPRHPRGRLPERCTSERSAGFGDGRGHANLPCQPALDHLTSSLFAAGKHRAPVGPRKYRLMQEMKTLRSSNYKRRRQLWVAWNVSERERERAREIERRVRQLYQTRAHLQRVAIHDVGDCSSCVLIRQDCFLVCSSAGRRVFPHL